MLRAIIIDDEPIAISGLTVLIEKYCANIKVVSTSADPVSGIKMIDDYRPDVVFLDITMPRINGFELLEAVSFRDFKVVFTTAHEEHAIRAIKSKAEDYLLKPIDVDELKNCVATLEASDAVNSEKKFGIVELSVKNGIIFIRPEEIVRLEASGSYTTFYLDGGVKHVASKNLKECELMLDPRIFYRSHPSHVVHLEKIVRLISADSLQIKMKDGSVAEIIRKRKHEFLQRLKQIGDRAKNI